MTKTKVITTVGTALLVSAFATPVYARQGPPPSLAEAAYNWTGVNLGAHVGENFSTSTSQTFNTLTGAPIGSTGSSQASHVSGGIQGGYDYMTVSRVVIGFQAGESVWGLTDTTTTSEGASVHTNQSKTDWAGSAAGRLGYSADRLLVYVVAGWTFSSGSVTRTQVTGTTGNAVPGTVEMLSVHHSHWTAGGGVTVAAGRHVLAGVEYRYTPGSNTNTFAIAERSTSSTSTTNGITAGVSWHF